MAFVFQDNASIVNAIHINKSHNGKMNVNDEQNLIQLRDQLKLTQTDKLKQQNILRNQIQAHGKQKFVGTLLWDFIDVLTFGSLEKPPHKKHTDPPKSREEPGKPHQFAEQNDTKKEESIKPEQRKKCDTKKDEKKRENMHLTYHVTNITAPGKQTAGAEDIKEVKKEVVKQEVEKDVEEKITAKKSKEAEEKLLDEQMKARKQEEEHLRKAVEKHDKSQQEKQMDKAIEEKERKIKEKEAKIKEIQREAEEKLKAIDSEKEEKREKEADETEEKPAKKESLEKKIQIEKAALDVKKDILDPKVLKKEKEEDLKQLKEETEQKKHNEKEDKDDPIITYLSLISAHHASKLDRSYVESVFDSYSIQPKDNKDESAVQTGENDGESDPTADDDLRVVTKGNAILAYEEIFQMWKFDLTLEQQKKVKEVYFPQTWLKFAENGNLDEKDSYRFLKDLMTEQVSKKDKSVEAYRAVKSAKQLAVDEDTEPEVSESQVDKDISVDLDASDAEKAREGILAGEAYLHNHQSLSQKKNSFKGLHMLDKSKEIGQVLSNTKEVSQDLKQEASQLSSGMHEFNKELMKIKNLKEEYDSELMKEEAVKNQKKDPKEIATSIVQRELAKQRETKN